MVFKNVCIGLDVIPFERFASILTVTLKLDRLFVNTYFIHEKHLLGLSVTSWDFYRNRKAVFSFDGMFSPTEHCQFVQQKQLDETGKKHNLSAPGDVYTIIFF